MQTGFYLGSVKESDTDLIFYYDSESKLFYFKNFRYTIDQLNILDMPIVTVLVKTMSKGKVELDVVRIKRNGSYIHLTDFEI